MADATPDWSLLFALIIAKHPTRYSAIREQPAFNMMFTGPPLPPPRYQEVPNEENVMHACE